MWIKVKIRKLRSLKEEVTSTYMNNGFRAGKPKISLPIPLANLLDFNVEHAKLSVDYTTYGSIHPLSEN